jgi:hypothetical protein
VGARAARVEVAEHHQPAGLEVGSHGAEVGVVAGVHGQHHVAVVEPGALEPLRPVPAGVVPVHCQERRRAPVHRIADVPAAGAGADHLHRAVEPRVGEPLGEHHVGHR